MCGDDELVKTAVVAAHGLDVVDVVAVAEVDVAAVHVEEEQEVQSSRRMEW